MVNYGLAPSSDILGTNRKADGKVDIGAVEYVAPVITTPTVSPTSLSYGNVVIGSASPSQTLTLTNPAGGAILTGIALTSSSARFTRPTGAAGGTCGVTLAVGATCTINISVYSIG